MKQIILCGSFKLTTTSCGSCAQVVHTQSTPGEGDRGEGDASSPSRMQCPYCRAIDDKVVDSRLADEGAAIRRRRECLGCGRRFTTHERAEAVLLRVRKRSGEAVPFDRSKVTAGIEKACVNRPVTEEGIERMAMEIEEVLRAATATGEVTSQEVGLAVLDRLRETDPVAYLRFASVYKDFQEATDFEREVGQLLDKKTPPKAAARSGDDVRGG